MTKRFLVPLDGSAEAEVILPSVEGLASQGDVFVLLMAEHPEHRTRKGLVPGNPVVSYGAEKVGTTPDMPEYVETEDQLIDRQLSEAHDYLEGIATHLRDQGFAVETNVELENDTAKAIIGCAREASVDLIAMLSGHHRNLLQGLFGGDASDEVVEAGVAPVLLIPQK